MFAITFASKTDIGRVRTLNQDSLATLTAPDLEEIADGLFVIADGIGGGKGGEIASDLAVKAVRTSVRADLKAAALADSAAPSAPPPDTLIAIVQASLKAANAVVWKQGRQVYAQQGMGTTCVMALLCKDSLILGNVGDSRAYRLRAGRLEQMTHDHAFLDAGHGSRSAGSNDTKRVHFRHVMTRAIGFASVVEPEVEVFTLLPGDAYLLCSDGLSNLLDTTEIATLLAAHDTPQTTCDRLVAAANRSGGDDNITVIVLHYGIAASDKPAAESSSTNSPLSNSSLLSDSAAEPDSEQETSAALPEDTARSWRKRWKRFWLGNFLRLKAN